MKFLSGDGSAEAPRVPIGEMVERVLELQPRLQRTLQVPIPDEVSSRLGAVTPRQLEALGCLPPGGSTMHEFAEAVGISGAAATALANRMIRQGLAQRHYDPGDRRTVWLSPTDQGLETVEAVRDWRRRSVAKMFERLDATQVTAFLEVLSALASSDRSPDTAESDPRPTSI